MKSLIMSKYVNLGGTQYLSSIVKNILLESGYEMDILTGKTHKYAPNETTNLLETDYPFFPEKSKIGIFRNIIRLKKEFKKIDFSNYDFTFNNHPNNFLFNADVNYLHGPSFVESFLDQDDNFRKNPIFYLTKISKIYKVFDGATFLTHGTYTKRISQKYFPYLGVKPKRIEYLFTPVETSLSVDFGKKQKNSVLVFGRISPEKNLDFVIELASRIRANFIISGYVSSADSSYLQSLEDKKSSNVKIVPNPSPIEKQELFARAWTYLHSKEKEHFGVTIAEAISSGCVPVVHKSGGAWEDVVDKGRYGLGFSSIEEAVQKIHESFEIAISSRMDIYESRSRFSLDDFKRRFIELFLTDAR